MLLRCRPWVKHNKKHGGATQSQSKCGDLGGCLMTAARHGSRLTLGFLIQTMGARAE